MVERAVLDALSEYKVEGKLAVAFSGGADSLALLSALSILRPGEVSALYVNHNIRSESELEEEIELNRKNAEKLGVGLKVLEIGRGEVERHAKERRISIEASARELRYALLLNEDCDWLFTAHTASDQIESVMMRLIYGSTLSSLSGIRKRRGKIIRPLLSLSRKDIEDYVTKRGLPYSSDSTNDTLQYRRNRIRKLIVPILSESEKQLILEISENLQSSEEKFSLKLEEEKHYVHFSRGEFLSAPDEKSAMLLFRLLDCFDEGRITSGEIKEIAKAVRNRTRYVGRKYILSVKGDDCKAFLPPLYFSRAFREGPLPGGFEVARSADERAIALPSSYSGTIRLSEEGDEITLKAGRTEVRKLLSEYGIPYCFVLQSRDGIDAIFASCLGGRDRVSRRLLDSSWEDKIRYVIR